MNFTDFTELLRANGLLVSTECNADENPIAKTISCDSRQVEEGTFFFAKGLNFKNEYLISAQNSGAVAYIAEDHITGQGCTLPRITVTDIRLAMPLCAKYFYGDPSSQYKLTGITGTKGKTTVAYMLKNIFDSAFNGKTGIISTNEALSCGKPMPKSCTTPEALELYGILNGFAKDGAEGAVIEVSSQGLQYNRIEYVNFFAGVYLNLSPDHVSPTEHHSFEEYKTAKKRMLTLCKNGFLNLDDPYAEEMSQAATCENLYTFGLTENADFYAKNIKETPYGTEFTLHGKFYNGEKISISIPGDFNVYNALAAISVATVYGIDINVISKALKSTTIAGRMEIYKMADRTVVVDYAHNGLSFEGIFRYAKKFFGENRIICLFGCPGNKALDRRKDLAEVAGANADHIILTSDDPANEEPEDIIAQIEAYLSPLTQNYEKIVDREEAITRAAEISRPGDVIILAGKGHEHTQAVRGKAVPYSGDKEGAEKAFKKLMTARKI